MNRTELKTQLTRCFDSVLDSMTMEPWPAQTTDTLAEILDFEPPTTSPLHADSIVAFSFGYRRQANGNVEPGPINGELSSLTLSLMQANQRASVFAQHEIGEPIAPIAPRAIQVVYPNLAPTTDVEYLSTAGVWNKILERVGGPAGLGTTLVLGHRMHVPRICRLGRYSGVECFVPDTANLPTSFDPSPLNQPWCRDARAFVIHSIVNDLVFFRRHILSVEAPSTRTD